MSGPFDISKSGKYAAAGFVVGILLLIAVFDYQSSTKSITYLEFFGQSGTQNLLLALVVAIPTVCGIVVGSGVNRIKALRRNINAITKEREKLIKAQGRIRGESSKLQGLLDQESGLFVDNWDQLVTEKDTLREEAEVSSALLKVSLAIGSLAGEKEVLAMMDSVLPSALFADNCVTFTWDQKTNAFVSEEVSDIRLNTRTSPVTKKLVSNQKPIAIDDVTKGDLIPKKIIDKFGIKSTILIPCVKRDNVDAIAMVIYEKAPHSFNERDIQIASGIVSSATIVLDNADLYGEIVANHDELKRLMTRLAESQEEERRRFSRDLHDGVIQNLSGIIFSLSFLENGLSKEEDAIKEIKQIEGIVEETIADLRQVIYDLRPTILDSLGLVPTLEKHLQRFGKMNKVKTIYQPKLDERLTGHVETALFRLAQEALNNIKKHAKANTVTLELKQNHKNVIMCIKDDGLGFDIKEARKRFSQDSGFGLSGMRERVQSLSGDVEIRSKPGEGTMVEVTVPTDTKGS